MASNPPQDCCTQGFKFEGTPAGSETKVGDGFDAYVTGDRSSPRVLLLLTDVLGYKFVNSQLVADNYAKQGYYVVVPDICRGDPTKLGEGLPEGWIDRHNVEYTEPVVHSTLEWIRKELNPKFVASVGYCFGARYVIRLLGQSAIDVGAAAHPSFVQIEEVAAVKKPLVILGAETDPIYTPDLRAQTEAKLKEVNTTYYTTLASGVSHGFAVRADPKDKWATLQANKAFNDSVWWFSLFH